MKNSSTHKKKNYISLYDKGGKDYFFSEFSHNLAFIGISLPVWSLIVEISYKDNTD